MSSDRRLRFATSAAIVAAYALLFLPLYSVRGPGIAALAMIPVGILAWLWGARTGVVAGIAAFPLHLGLMAVDGVDGLSEFVARGGPGQLVLVAVGGVIGRLGDQQRALRTQAAELERERSSGRERESSYRQLVESSNVIVWEVDVSSGRFTFVSPQAEHILGYLPDEWYELDFWSQKLHPADAERTITACASATARLEDHELEYRMLTADGREVWLQDIVSVVVDDGKPTLLRGVMVDITARKRAEEQAAWHALHDPLTGLPNRRLAVDRVRESLARSIGCVAVILADIDDFRLVNDAIGHQAGDELLVATARRLTAAAGPGSTVARVGSDEYAVVIEGLGADEAQVVAERCRSLIHAAVPMDRRQHRLTASVGVAVGQVGAVTAETLFAQADAALLDAKRGGPSRLRMFDSHMTAEGRQRLELEADLRRAIDNGELLVDFQPIVDLASQRVVAVEALARWHHESRGWVSPASFIPAAERSDLILEVGRVVLETTCRELAAWHRHYPGLTASVNVSTIELSSPGLVSNVEAALAHHQLSASALTLEITETSMITDARAAADAVTRLRRLGVRVVLDDFGTGYDSLNTLKRLTVDGLKIDLGFVQAMCKSPKDAAIVGAILAFGHAVGVEVTAEGIETTEQYEHLRQLGCGRGQGYLFGRPSPASDLTPAIIASSVVPEDPGRDLPVAMRAVEGLTARAARNMPSDGQGMGDAFDAPALGREGSRAPSVTSWPRRAAIRRAGRGPRPRDPGARRGGDERP